MKTVVVEQNELLTIHDNTVTHNGQKYPLKILQ
jgi:hemin uptake protein HemP